MRTKAATPAPARARSLILRAHEATRLAETGEIMIVREVNVGKLKFTPSWIGWIGDSEDGPGWYAQDVDGGQFEPAECWGEVKLPCPFGPAGSPLVGKEGWAPRLKHDGTDDQNAHYVKYRADAWDEDDRKSPHNLDDWHQWPDRWRSSTSMPPWASRFPRLIHESSEVKRVQEITPAEVVATGVMNAAGVAHLPCETFYEPGVWDQNRWAWFVLVRNTEHEAKP